MSQLLYQITLRPLNEYQAIDKMMRQPSRACFIIIFLNKDSSKGAFTQLSQNSCRYPVSKRNSCGSLTAGFLEVPFPHPPTTAQKEGIQLQQQHLAKERREEAEMGKMFRIIAPASRLVQLWQVYFWRKRMLVQNGFGIFF